MDDNKNLLDKNTNIFLAGHNGLVGKSIRKILKSKFNCNIIVKERSDLDLCNQEKVNTFLKVTKIDYIIIAAARVGGIRANSTFPADFINENLLIQNNLINGAFINKINRILFLGSSCIYPKDINEPIREELLLSGFLEKTNEAYAIAKIAGLKMCEFYNKQHLTCYRSVMPTNLYGEGDNFDEHNGHVIPSLIRRFHDAKINQLNEVYVWGSGKPLREFMHVDDMADACVFVMNLDDLQYSSALGKNVSHINIGTGQEVTINELASTIARVVDYKGRILFDDTKPDGTKRKLLNIKRLSSLGWRSKITLEHGLLRTYDWFKKQHG
jgi:GDP-L-fucose synthase